MSRPALTDILTSLRFNLSSATELITADGVGSVKREDLNDVLDDMDKLSDLIQTQDDDDLAVCQSSVPQEHSSRG